MASNPASTSVRFMRFVEQAKALMSVSPPTDQFLRFVALSEPLVEMELAQTLRRLKPRIDLVREWLLPADLDLLHVAGLSFVEDAYTELLAWALSPRIHPESALCRQVAWLKALDISELPITAAVPETQVVTDDGIPDLILPYSTLTVIVEAKTATDEHETPMGRFQTVAYVDAIRRKLGLPAEAPVKMVFISPDGREAENPHAINTTFSAFVLAMAHPTAKGIRD